MITVTLTQRINYTKFNLRYTEISEVINMIRIGDMPLYDKESGKYISLQRAVL